ncbi:MAG: hypothetical protein Q4G61_05090 [Tissierellia bacterium]|nr:hypothetical protein [Tissierellia bacterium]
MKKYSQIIWIIALLFVLSGCAETSLSDNLEGRVDKSKTVEYLVVPSDQKQDVLFLLTGQMPEEEPPAQTTQPPIEEEEPATEGEETEPDAEAVDEAE